MLSLIFILVLNILDMNDVSAQLTLSSNETIVTPYRNQNSSGLLNYSIDYPTNWTSYIPVDMTCQDSVHPKLDSSHLP